MATVKFPKQYIEKLNKAAAAEGKSIEEFVTDAVDAYMAREKAKAKGNPAPEAEPRRRKADDVKRGAGEDSKKK